MRNVLNRKKNPILIFRVLVIYVFKIWSIFTITKKNSDFFSSFFIRFSTIWIKKSKRHLLRGDGVCRSLTRTGPGPPEYLFNFSNLCTPHFCQVQYYIAHAKRNIFKSMKRFFFVIKMKRYWFLFTFT